MPTAPVDNNVELFFLDSGPVVGSTDYTTFVVYHGSAFNGNTFSKLLPFAAPSNIRLVLVNRRGYAGSTGYTDAELKELQGGQKSFMEMTGRQVANFLIWFAETHDIPQMCHHHKTGGFCVMGWSFGSATSLSVLGHPEAMPKDSYRKLEPYLRQIILYDGPFNVLGYTTPSLQYSPFRDPDLKTPQAMWEGFGSWTSGYFNHRSLTSGLFSDLDLSKHGEHPSFDNMTPAEKELTFDWVAAMASELPMYIYMLQVLKDQTRKALFDEQAVKEVLPHLDVVYISCTRTHWSLAWGAVELRRQIKEEAQQGRKVRTICFKDIPGENHFAHWDVPDVFWAATVDVVNG